MNNSIIELKNVTKHYHRGSETVHALEHATFAIERGGYIAISGPSGSGKTTLMNIMGALDRPASGTVIVNDREIQHATEQELAKVRLEYIGFVFQQFFLIPTLTVLENVELPAMFARTDRADRARELLGRVGLGHRLSHLPGQLSGGEMQRVAIARSLINNPPVILADEPTGNLDSKNAESIMSLFEQINADGITVVVVTHNPDLVKRCRKALHIEDGKIHE